MSQDFFSYGGFLHPQVIPLKRIQAPLKAPEVVSVQEVERLREENAKLTKQRDRLVAAIRKNNVNVNSLLPIVLSLDSFDTIEYDDIAGVIESADELIGVVTGMQL